MESSLTPRDMQARIRRGDSIEEVAEAAGITVERVHGFAVPVIAEREWMAQSARATTVRRKHVGGPAVALAELADAALAGRGVDPDDARWDAWRREDGRWTVSVGFGDGDAAFLYDPKSRYVVADDDRARDLVGDLATEEQHDMALADLVTEAPEAFGGAVAEDQAIDTAPLVRSIKEARDRRAMEQAVFESPEEVEEVVAVDSELTESIAVPDTPKPTRRKQHARRSVPSWDEIMFGGASE